MDDYKPNSHKYKESQRTQTTEKKKVEKVVSGKVHKKKKNRFVDLFISEDAANVKSYVFMDFLYPSFESDNTDPTDYW